MADERKDNELILPLGTHAFVLDATNGRLSTACGPTKLTLQNTDDLVQFDPTNVRRFRKVTTGEAVQANRVVPKGWYAVLKNPAGELKFPQLGKQGQELTADLLEIGKVVNLPGPKTFALWPGQEVQIIEGHHLKTNQYLIVRVYDEDEARKNWAQGTIKLAEPAKVTGEAGQPPVPVDQGASTTTTFLDVDPKTLVIGQLLLIRGTDVSFYMPPTGVEVVPDEQSGFVREALTLERLEYCLLADQDGNKRYVQGPDVVFPKPTETFKLNDDNSRKSKAYELNDISGIHIKVIADYEDAAPDGVSKDLLQAAGFHVSDDGANVSNRKGEELFITGKVQAIYFPRIEHAILTYGDNRRSRYHAVAIPPGEARYVMNRLTGKIHLVRGEAMLLPDPRTEVIVQRVLSDAECARYYPGNDKVLAYNRMLREQNSDPELAALMNLSNVSGAAYRSGHVMADAFGESATRSLSMKGSRASDVIDRGTKFTPHRTLVLDPKFEGAPKISPWTGYAIQLVNAKGTREVVVGPQTINLEFDQRLETLFLSTKTPKIHDQLFATSYLKTVNNVSDEIDLVSNDLVPIKVRLKYLIRFNPANKDAWFNVDNYIQLLVDHFRSTISNLARQEKAPVFFMTAATLLQDWVLGEMDMASPDGLRPGHTFAENGMEVYGLEVISVQIMDGNIANAMKKAQTEALTAQFEMSTLQTTLDLTRTRENVAREIASEQYSTREHASAIAVKGIELEHTRELTNIQRAMARSEEEAKAASVRQQIAEIEANTEIKEFEPEKQKAIHELDVRCKELVAEAAAAETRSKAVQPALVEALVALASTGALEVAAKHLGNLAILKDMSLGGIISQVFEGTGQDVLLANLQRLGKGKLLEPSSSK